MHDHGFFTTSWQRTWADLGLPAPAGLLEQVLARYQEPQRKYHTTEHLAECLAHITPALPLTERPGEVALALWLHDAVYDLHAKDNEAQSARWASAALLEAGSSAATAERVAALILATEHAAQPSTPDACWVVDTDLAILGSSPERFAAYEAQIRAEYAWVPGWLFRRKRKAVLQNFLQRPQIYATDYFRSRYEAPARANLQQAIAQPNYIRQCTIAGSTQIDTIRRHK